MVDWEGFIQERFAEHGSDVPDAEQTISELAAHLEELFAHWCDVGLDQNEAARRALSEVPDWQALFAEISRVRNKEATVNTQMKRILVPGIVALLCSIAGLSGPLRHGLFGEGFNATSTVSLLIYLPWLAMQPLLGICGAYLSNGFGGRRNDAWKIWLFGVFTPFVLYLQKVLVELLLPNGPVGTWSEPALVLRYWFSCFLYWVALPSLAFLAGMLIFWTPSQRLSHKGRIELD